MTKRVIVLTVTLLCRGSVVSAEPPKGWDMTLPWDAVPPAIKAIGDIVLSYIQQDNEENRKLRGEAHERDKSDREEERIERLQNLRMLVSRLAGEEAAVAGELRRGLNAAMKSEARERHDARINAALRRAEATFTELAAATGTASQIPNGAPVQSISGLACVQSDGILSGYSPEECARRFAPHLLSNGARQAPMFGAGRRLEENAKLNQKISDIQLESQFLYFLAGQLVRE